MEYLKHGICIWCGKSKPQVSFNNKPHILPECLGGRIVGFDVCDDCNSFFGTSIEGVPSLNIAFKEVFSCIRLLLGPLDKNSYKNFGSAYFNYKHSKSLIEMKTNFPITKESFVRIFTRQFKKSLFEVFLQMYHYITADGLNNKFNDLRAFCRYGIGDLKVYHIKNEVLLIPQDLNNPEIFVGESNIKDINEYGFFPLLIFGHWFFLEVVPNTANIIGHENYLKIQTKHIIPVKGYECIFELEDFRDIDIFLTRFNRVNIIVKN